MFINRRQILVTGGEPPQPDNNGGGGNPCLGCFLFLLSIFILINLDALLHQPTGDSEGSAVRDPDGTDLGGTSGSSSPLLLQNPPFLVAPAPFPATSYILTGSYSLHRLNSTALTEDWGTAQFILYSRPSIIRTLRLSSLQLRLSSKTRSSDNKSVDGSLLPSSQVIYLTGPELRDATALTLQGVSGPMLRAPDVANVEKIRQKAKKLRGNSKADSVKGKCALFGSFKFDRSPQTSRSARSMSDSGGFRFDGEGGGSWDRDASLSPLDADESDLWTRKLQAGAPTPFGGASTLPETSTAAGEATSQTSSPDIEGVLLSPDCQFRMVLWGREVDLIALANGVFRFAGFYILKGLLEIRFFLKQIWYTEDRTALKICPLSVGLQICIDLFEVIILIAESVISDFLTSTFVVLIIFKLMFVSILELRYLASILRARFLSNPADPADATNRENDLTRIVKFHAVGTAVVLIWVLKLIPMIPSIIISLYLFWLSQILFDIWKGNRRSLSLSYILGMSFCRILFPLYLWGCPVGIFQSEIFRRAPGSPNFTLCIALVSVMAAQVGWLLLQHYCGPRFLIPLAWLPQVYNYYRPLPKQENEQIYECVICMTDVSYIQKTLVTTPCDHHFHETCLQQWMDVKAECPTCRRALPPFS